MTNKPMLSIELQLTEQQERDLTRFYDTCEDSQPYDVPKDRMKSLACVGLVRSLGFSRYELTDAGGAAVEKLRALLDEPPHIRQEGYGEAMEKVVAALEDQSRGACNGCANGCKLDRESPQVQPAAPRQDEPVAIVDETDDGLFIEFVYGENGNPLKRGDKLYTDQPAPVAEVPKGYCIMPRRLTAENGAKALLLGEFQLEVSAECPECRDLEEPLEGCEFCDGEGEYEQRHIIPWDQIKVIYSQAVAGLARINKPL